MLRRRDLIAAAVSGAALAGCGGNAVQPPAALPAGAVSRSAGAQGAASPSVSASLPADLAVDFQRPSAADPRQTAAVNAAEQLVYAFEQAVARGRSADPLVQGMVTGEADVQLTQLLGQLTAKGTRPSGTITFFRVTPSAAGTFLGVGFCEDDSKAVQVSVKDGSRKGGAPTGTAALRQWNIGFAKDGSGNLRIDYLLTQSGSRACV